MSLYSFASVIGGDSYSCSSVRMRESNRCCFYSRVFESFYFFFHNFPVKFSSGASFSPAARFRESVGVKSITRPTLLCVNKAYTLSYFRTCVALNNFYNNALSVLIPNRIDNIYILEIRTYTKSNI